MKFIIPITAVLFIAFLVTFDGFVNPDRKKSAENVNETQQISPTTTRYPTVMYQDAEYAFLLKRQIEAANLVLINNTGQKRESSVLVADFKCVSGINGGFYDENHKPLGWMMISGKEISGNKSSQLFNGYVIISKNEFKIINKNETTLPEADFGLQSGPLLYRGGEPLKLTMARDKPARRMVIGQAADGVFFLSIFNKDAETAGPNLSDLPGVLAEVAEQVNLKIISALNMDGGSASAIYVPTGILKETAPVGSWWCEK